VARAPDPLPKPPAVGSPPAGESPTIYARNFTLTTAERVRAIVAGPPAWSVRLRRIELLEEEIVAALVAEAHRTGAPPAAIPPVLSPRMATLDGLVAAHNAYYPIEANLPSDPRTRDVMDGGEPWRPMDARRAEVLLALARERSGW
jgi:hypothetical protein